MRVYASVFLYGWGAKLMRVCALATLLSPSAIGGWFRHSVSRLASSLFEQKSVQVACRVCVPAPTIELKRCCALPARLSPGLGMLAATL